MKNLPGSHFIVSPVPEERVFPLVEAKNQANPANENSLSIWEHECVQETHYKLYYEIQSYVWKALVRWWCKMKALGQNKP